ncbi:hypothetical protein [Hymenobacter sp. BT491]|uniref:hypothetical protein n=1 Tax=Hymenobacter sp. BT491 TaxID=2766779 RepID=UPI0016538200|nr:hypothetical protein [Hymenobacter sp. BT491]MBC6988652.1 hypothetical protein [Hymenobacter sp. BT491]
MHTLRRHRRKLLFPPGLLALGFVLLLGCMQIAKHSHLRRHSVMVITMPPLQPRNFWDPTIYLPQENLNKFRKWDDMVVNGNHTHDSLALLAAYSLTSGYQQDTAHARGLRVYFTDKARYGSLVRLFDIMNINSMQKYWLDIRRAPTAFYAFTDRRSPYSDSVKRSKDSLPIISCGRSDYHFTPKPLSIWDRFDNWTNSFWELATWQPLYDSAWRISIYLLLLIAAVSVWKMVKSDIGLASRP